MELRDLTEDLHECLRNAFIPRAMENEIDKIADELERKRLKRKVRGGSIAALAAMGYFTSSRKHGFCQWPRDLRRCECAILNFFDGPVYDNYAGLFRGGFETENLCVYTDLYSNSLKYFVNEEILEHAFKIAQGGRIIYTLKCSIQEGIYEIRKVEEDALIRADFFGDGIHIDVSRIFPVVVMATMSSGKSTLVNALLGEDVLPSKNAACTAKAFSILDDDTAEKTKIYITRQDGTLSVIEDHLAEELEKANQDDEVKEILICGDIKGVQNTQRSLLLIDTPGPNNSRNESHGQVTQDIMEKVKGGLILYVMNATQMGINDDKQFLALLQEQLKEKQDLQVLFVMNKVDELDTERESIPGLIRDAREYLRNNGIENPEIIPVSALAASLFKKAKNKEPLTRRQKRDLMNFYEIFGSRELRLATYALMNTGAEPEEVIEIGEEIYSVMQLENAIDNTGLPYLERRVQNYQILSSETEPLKIGLK